MHNMKHDCTVVAGYYTISFKVIPVLQLDCTALVRPEEPPTTQQTFRTGSRGARIACRKLGESTETESNFSNEQATGMRRTWSNSDIRNDKIWIKASPTDSLLDVKATQRKSSVNLEEGLEVVAMGRLRTVGDELAEDYSNDDVDNDSGHVSDGSDGSHHGLSNPFESSEHIQVATFRP